MFSILIKGKNYTSLDWVGADIHSHLLPALDDGSPDAATSVKMISRLRSLGISHIYTTPHVFKELYPNTRKKIDAALTGLIQELKKEEPGTQVFAAAEYMTDADFELLYQTEKLLCLPGNHLLIEMPLQIESAYIDLYLFTLQTLGYRPVMAHPERYLYCHSSFDRYKHYKNLGCLFQMNILSPYGYYGPLVKRASIRLLKEGMVDLIGTDLHKTQELYAIEKFVLSGNVHKVFRENPIKNAELFTK